MSQTNETVWHGLAPPSSLSTKNSKIRRQQKIPYSVWSGQDFPPFLQMQKEYFFFLMGTFLSFTTRMWTESKSAKQIHAIKNTHIFHTKIRSKEKYSWMISLDHHCTHKSKNCLKFSFCAKIHIRFTLTNIFLNYLCLKTCYILQLLKMIFYIKEIRF